MSEMKRFRGNLIMGAEKDGNGLARIAFSRDMDLEELQCVRYRCNCRQFKSRHIKMIQQTTNQQNQQTTKRKNCTVGLLHCGLFPLSSSLSFCPLSLDVLQSP